MDLGERYYQLSRLGRDTFCASVAQATLVRAAPQSASPPELALGTGSGVTNLPVHAAPSPEQRDQAATLLAGASFSTNKLVGQGIIPLVKKIGTPFVDLITIGRTDGNDVMLEDLSVSRFQAFFRRRHGRWFICDAGSSNGTLVNGARLSPRTEAEVTSRFEVRFGAAAFHFHTADSLYDVLARRPSTGVTRPD